MKLKSSGIIILLLLASFGARAQFFAADSIQLCPGDVVSVNLDTGHYDTVTWFVPPNDTLIDTFQLDFNVTGWHKGVATDTNGVTDIDSVFIDVLSVPFLNISDQELCYGQRMTIEVPNPMLFDTIVWNDSLYQSFIVVDDSGTHIVSAWSQNCEIMDTVRIDTCISTLDIIPTVFTPNGDGVNDLLDYQGQNFSIFDLHVFDRWGREVFKTESHSIKWNGILPDGREAKVGVYYWTLRYRLLTRTPPPTVECAGQFTLLR